MCIDFLYCHIQQFNVQIAGTATQGTITGLSPHTTYNCTIYAVSGSDGPVSDPITVTTNYERKCKYFVCLSDVN